MDAIKHLVAIFQGSRVSVLEADRKYLDTNEKVDKNQALEDLGENCIFILEQYCHLLSFILQRQLKTGGEHVVSLCASPPSH